MERAALPVRRNPARAVVKRVLHVLIKATVLTIRAIKRHPIPALIVATILIGSYFAITSGTLAATWLGTASATTNTRPAAIESFLDGQRSYDANKIWDSLGDEMKQGQSIEAAQQTVESAKQRGIHYGTYQYVGGLALNDGGSVHLYVVSISNGTQERQIPFTFTLNKAGKIAKIE